MGNKTITELYYNDTSYSFGADSENVVIKREDGEGNTISIPLSDVINDLCSYFVIETNEQGQDKIITDLSLDNIDSNKKYTIYSTTNLGYVKDDGTTLVIPSQLVQAQGSTLYMYLPGSPRPTEEEINLDNIEYIDSITDDSDTVVEEPEEEDNETTQENEGVDTNGE